MEEGGGVDFSIIATFLFVLFFVFYVKMCQFQHFPMYAVGIGGGGISYEAFCKSGLFFLN